MSERRFKVILLMAGALAFCVPVWSDVRAHPDASNRERMCYCDCEAKAGSPVCTHMCELAKYENRSWATSCHKKADDQPEQPSLKPGARSTKNNGIQEARR